jgi:hypothetical protein
MFSQLTNFFSPLETGRFGEAVSTSTSSSDGTDDSPSTQVIIVGGVSTEVTVGIALASFVIGVGLTAILWCIHTRTGKNVIYNFGQQLFTYYSN